VGGGRGRRRPKDGQLYKSFPPPLPVPYSRARRKARTTAGLSSFALRRGSGSCSKLGSWWGNALRGWELGREGGRLCGKQSKGGGTATNGENFKKKKATN